MKNLCILIILSIVSSVICGCAPNVSPNTYDAAEAGVASKVVQGVVIGKRKVNIDARSGAGGLAGAAAGAVGGSAIGGSDRGHIAGALGGAVLGGLLGNAIDKKINRHQAYEYIIKLKSGNTISVAQTEELQFAIHQPVLVIYGATTRIVPDECVEQPELPKYRQVGRQVGKARQDKMVKHNVSKTIKKEDSNQSDAQAEVKLQDA